MKDNVSLGELSTHTGTLPNIINKIIIIILGAITCLEFFEDSHLISGSEVSYFIQLRLEIIFIFNIFDLG